MKNYINEIKVFLYGVFISLNIDINIAKILVILMTIDLAFGMVKAIHLSDMRFSFKILFKGICLKMLVLLLPMVTALTAKGLGFEEFEFMISLVMKLFIIAETISIYNSFLSIKKGKEIKQNDLIAEIVDKIQVFLKNKFDKLLSIFEK